MIQNILGLALTAIPVQQARLYRWKGRKTNDRGLDVNTFYLPEPLTGSIQPVDRKRYELYGLDSSKDYISIYSKSFASTVTHTENPDEVEYGGRRWRLVASADWHAPSDYSGMLAVDIGPASGGE